MRSLTSSLTIETKAGSVPGVAALASGRPSLPAVSAASTSRSNRTSTWSETKPTGTRTTARAPARARSARQSLTSGSSHGWDGGPLRLEYASRQGRWPPGPPARSATSRDASASCAGYAPPPGPLAAAIASGMLCAVNTSSASF